MKLLDAILLAIITAFFIMAIYHTYRFGLLYSYHLFMIVALGLLWLNVRGVGKAKATENLPKPKQNKQKNK